MYKRIKIVFVLIFISIVIWGNNMLFAMELNVNPNVIEVSSGPIFWKNEKEGYRFRVVAVLSEVYVNIFIQRIDYGEEGCCASVIKTYELVSENVKYQLYSVSEIEWYGVNVFKFKGNSTNYKVTNIDNKYLVEIDSK